MASSSACRLLYSWWSRSNSRLYFSRSCSFTIDGNILQARGEGDIWFYFEGTKQVVKCLCAVHIHSRAEVLIIQVISRLCTRVIVVQPGLQDSYRAADLRVTANTIINLCFSGSKSKISAVLLHLRSKGTTTSFYFYFEGVHTLKFLKYGLSPTAHCTWSPERTQNTSVRQIIRSISYPGR